MRIPTLPRRRAAIAALIALPLAVAGVTRPGHTQDTYQGGLWRGSDGSVWCGGGCNRAIHQVCCTFTVNES
jgi:hypothetical protein